MRIQSRSSTSSSSSSSLSLPAADTGGGLAALLATDCALPFAAAPRPVAAPLRADAAALDEGGFVAFAAEVFEAGFEVVLAATARGAGAVFFAAVVDAGFRP
jgi:hypothetical protein